MSRLIRTVRRTILSSSSLSLSHLQCRNAISSLFLQSRPYKADKITKSTFEANILRILHNEIDYQSEYAPPHQPATKFDSFDVQDRPGEQWMTMRRTFSYCEDIKLEVTMFDGYETVPNTGEDSSGEDVRVHISVLVDISKGDGGDALEFLCSAWPDCLEIRKVYLLSRDNTPARPYMGPNFRSLNRQLPE
ncbi:uncharacterized protein LOC105637577 isoform X2 [Jatropha curcas]|uniref:uncharacterized protein LOC105637577 isoform X2 n=1 Tax=Jatropha curcas TaxID=180498 RepID=UPI001895C8B5|nr:uncharacterized protein LOC105637577 isoform X2 [Jatropha curcas]